MEESVQRNSQLAGNKEALPSMVWKSRRPRELADAIDFWETTRT